MLTVKELIAVLQMEKAIGAKPCGCSPSRDCAHDRPRVVAMALPRPAPEARMMVSGRREMVDPVTGEVLYVPADEADP